jgi:Ca2+-binding EF-hand superfamily protein
MKRTLALGLFGAALAATSLPAMAQPGPDGGPRRGPDRMQSRIFQQADADHDGRVTEAEAMAYADARLADADADKNGGVTPEELGTYLRAQMAAHRPSPASGRERRQPPPQAQRAMHNRMAMFFRVADANRDGSVTLEELRPVAAALFRAADASGDSVLVLEELRHGPQRPMGPRGDRHGPRHAPPAGAPEAPPPRG